MPNSQVDETSTSIGPREGPIKHGPYHRQSQIIDPIIHVMKPPAGGSDATKSPQRSERPDPRKPSERSERLRLRSQALNSNRPDRARVVKRRGKRHAKSASPFSGYAGRHNLATHFGNDALPAAGSSATHAPEPSQLDVRKMPEMSDVDSPIPVAGRRNTNLQMDSTMPRLRRRLTAHTSPSRIHVARETDPNNLRTSPCPTPTPKHGSSPCHSGDPDTGPSVPQPTFPDDTGGPGEEVPDELPPVPPQRNHTRNDPPDASDHDMVQPAVRDVDVSPDHAAHVEQGCTDDEAVVDHPETEALDEVEQKRTENMEGDVEGRSTDNMEGDDTVESSRVTDGVVATPAEKITGDSVAVQPADDVALNSAPDAFTSKTPSDIEDNEHSHRSNDNDNVDSANMDSGDVMSISDGESSRTINLDTDEDEPIGIDEEEREPVRDFPAADDHDDDENEFLGVLFRQARGRLFKSTDGFQSSEEDEDDDSDTVEYDSDKDRGEHKNASSPSKAMRFRAVRRRVKKVLGWKNILALLLVDGKITFSERQYGVVSRLVKALAGEDMPCPRTIRRTVRDVLSHHCYPLSNVLKICDNEHHNFFSPNDHTVPSSNAGVTDAMNCIRLVLPSEWMKMDVATASFYNSVFSPDRSDNDTLNIEFSNVVQNRKAFLHATPGISARFRDRLCTLRADIGDVVWFPCVQSTRLSKYRVSGWTQKDDEGIAAGSLGQVVCGSVGPTIGVGFRDAWIGESRCEPKSNLTHQYLLIERMLMSRLSVPTVHADNTVSRAEAETATRAGHGLAPMRQVSLTFKRTLVRLELYGGDTVTFIRPVCDTFTPSVMCIFIASPVSYALGKPAERIEWVRVTRTGNRKEITPFLSLNVKRLPFFDNREERMGRLKTTVLPLRNKGVLPTGERFLIYRAAIYADGFQQNKNVRQSRSVGGCYLVPLGLSEQERASTQGIRVLCLTAHGQPVNDAITSVLDDVHHCMTTGVCGVDPNGRKVRIFLDVVSMMGDMPQAASYSDVRGHSATTFCPLCTMRRRKDTRYPETNFTSDIQSMRMGYARFDSRRRAIRASYKDSALHRSLGLSTHIPDAIEKLPAVMFSNINRETRTDEGPCTGKHVLDPIFDHAKSIPALPDHVLSGLISNLMHVCFGSLIDDDQRQKVETLVVDAANENGIGVKRHILAWEKSRRGLKYKGVASNSMSSWFSVLLVSSAIFTDIYARTRRDVFLLPRKLEDVVMLLYKWPRAEVVGKKNWSWCFSDPVDQLEYQHELMRRTHRFLDSVRSYHARNPEMGRRLDKPITHRLLEVVSHTVPLYGHARLCSEMVCEHTHTQFKSWLSKSTHQDVHLVAMEKAIARDWLWRLSGLTRMWKEGNQHQRDQAEVGLLRLVLGEAGFHVNRTARDGLKVLGHLRQALQDAMREPIPTLLSESEQNNAVTEKGIEFKWSVLWKDTQSCLDPTIDAFLQNIAARGASDDVSPTDLEFFQRARFVPTAVGTNVSYPYSVVRVGDAVSAVVDIDASTGTDIHTVDDGSGRCSYFVVCAIAGNTNNGDVWVVVKELQLQGHDMSDLYSCKDKPMQLLQLTQYVRRIGLVHKCDDACRTHFSMGRVSHSAKSIDGGIYHVIARHQGYPPFLG